MILTISAALDVSTSSVPSLLPNSLTSSSSPDPSGGRSHPPVFHPAEPGRKPGAPDGGTYDELELGWAAWKGVVWVKAAGVFEIGRADETRVVQRVPALSSVGKTPLVLDEACAGGGVLA